MNLAKRSQLFSGVAIDPRKPGHNPSLTRQSPFPDPPLPVGSLQRSWSCHAPSVPEAPFRQVVMPRPTSVQALGTRIPRILQPDAFRNGLVILISRTHDLGPLMNFGKSACDVSRRPHYHQLPYCEDPASPGLIQNIGLKAILTRRDAIKCEASLDLSSIPEDRDLTCESAVQL
jgi:hypothetical protein